MTMLCIIILLFGLRLGLQNNNHKMKNTALQTSPYQVSDSNNKSKSFERSQQLPVSNKLLTVHKIFESRRNDIGVKLLIKEVSNKKFDQKHMNDTCIFKKTNSENQLHYNRNYGQKEGNYLEVNGISRQSIRLENKKNIYFKHAENAVEAGKSKKLNDWTKSKQLKKHQSIKAMICKTKSMTLTGKTLNIIETDDQNVHKQQNKQTIQNQVQFNNRTIKSQINMRKLRVHSVTFQVSKSNSSLKSNLMNPQQLRKLVEQHRKKVYHKNIFDRLKRTKYTNNLNLTDNSQQQTDKCQFLERSICQSIPNQLGINRIMLPKRSQKKYMFQNLKKLQDSMVKIRGKYIKCEGGQFIVARKYKQIKNKRVAVYIDYGVKSRHCEQNNMTNTRVLSKLDWQELDSEPLRPWATESPSHTRK